VKKVLFLAIAIIILFGCDPGWHYKPEISENSQLNQHRYTVLNTQDIKATVSCFLFSFGLTTKIEIFNHGSDSISVSLKSLNMTDAKGNTLSPDWVKYVGLKNDDLLILNPKDHCEIIGQYQVNPLVGPFGIFKNQNLRQLNISMDGIAHGKNQIPLIITLEWDL